MAMYNSFYGGRRGTSFVIVKNYLDNKTQSDYIFFVNSILMLIFPY